MTTIACTRTSIACDLQFTYAGKTKFKGYTKIFEPDSEVSQELFGIKRCYIGFSGSTVEWGNVVNYLLYPEGNLPRLRDIEFLMLTDKKKILHSMNLRNWMLIPDKYFSIGSGMQFAMGAMAAGGTAEDAIKSAIKHDPMTGFGVKHYSFD